METFEVEDLVAKITSANFRKELHGEARIAAVDLKLEVETDRVKTTAILSQLFGDDANSTDHLVGMMDAELLPDVSFPNDFDEHRVSMRVSTETLALFADAKVNNFHVSHTGSNAYKWTLRVQSLLGSADANSLVGAIQEKCAVSICAAQGELDLDADNDAKAA